MAEYDIAGTVAQYLDRHLVFPLLEFLDTNPNMQGVYKEEDILKAKLQLLSNTNMVDFAMEIFRHLYPDEEPVELLERREQVILFLRSLQDEIAPFIAVLENEELIRQLQEQNNFNAAYLEERFNITNETLESLYDYSKFQFDCGNYSASSEYLYVYRLLQLQNPERVLFALWGKFAADILLGSWDLALEDMNQLRELIDSQSKSMQLNSLQQLQQRTWLIHWSLFVFFKHPNGRNLIVDMLFQEKYMNTIQTNCPHILRYMATAVISIKHRRNVLGELVRVIQQERYNYHDPITDFIECVYANFDFEGAQNMLQKCEDTIKHDYFLVDMLEDFLASARLTIFETYCRIHQCIDIDMLAEKLNMDRTSAERWIVNLIRNAHLDAKIDSQANQVLMGVKIPSVYEQVVESTRGLSVRSNSLVQSFTRRGGFGIDSSSLAADGADGGGAGRGGGRGGHYSHGRDRSAAV